MLPKITIWGKKRSYSMSFHDFEAMLAFVIQNYHFQLVTKIIFMSFSKKKKKKKKALLVKFDIKNRFYDSFPFQKCILL